jgi:hypothetical protein
MKKKGDHCGGFGDSKDTPKQTRPVSKFLVTWALRLQSAAAKRCQANVLGSSSIFPANSEVSRRRDPSF